MLNSFNNKVSIIIPCYNKEAFVGDAIESALAQTYKNIEIICVNDGSTDNSSMVIQEYADKYKNILFFDETINHGVCAVRNMAIEASSGEYILPLDADDIIEPDYIEKAVRILDERPDVGIVYSKAMFFGKKKGEWKLEKYHKDKILFNNLIFCSALFRKKDFEKAGGYKEYMNNGCEDWDLWLSFIENGLEIYRIDEVLFHYRKLKEETRTDIALQSQLPIFKQVVKNHINLYLDCEAFYKRIFRDNFMSKISQKHLKYRKLFNIFLMISIVELILILLCLVGII